MSRVGPWLVVAAVATLALAGCLAPGDAARPPAGGLTRITVGDRSVDAFEGLLWHGSTLEPPHEGPDNAYRRFETPPQVGTCELPRCERVPFHLDLAPGDARAANAMLEVVVAWTPQDEDYATAPPQSILYYDPGFPSKVPPNQPRPQEEYFGAPRSQLIAYVHNVAEDRYFAGADGKPAPSGESQFWSKFANGLLGTPASGDFEFEVEISFGIHATDYQAIVRLRDAPAESDPKGEDVLPNLRMLTPRHLQVATPLGREASTALGPVHGCGPDEAAQTRVLRCLRFANYIANDGPGTFEMRLAKAEAKAAIGGQGSHWIQRVHRGDGTYRDSPSVEARFHPVHGHFHSQGIAEATVYEYNLDTHQRGDAIGAGRKTGFCFADNGVHNLRGQFANPPTRPEGAGCCYFADDCALDMPSEADYVMGLLPGWYDDYPWWRADQFVDITSATDGVYELVSVVNPDATVLETNPADNAGSILFRLTGDRVEELGTPPA